MPSHKQNKQKPCSQTPSGSESDSNSHSRSSDGGCCKHKEPNCNSCEVGVGGHPWVENCPPAACPYPCKGLKGFDLFQKYRSAVVRITAQTSLTTSANAADRVGNQLAYQTNFATLFVTTNGFFTNRHIIVAPAQVALLPPNTTSTLNRYPFTASELQLAGADGNTLLRADRFFADVFDVNGSGYAFSYQLQFLGTDPAGDVALFYINPSLAWNAGLPCIKKCHPFFKFGCNRKYRPGLPVYSVGDPFARSVALLPRPAASLNANQQGQLNNVSAASVYIEGKVQDNKQIDYTGYAPQELVSVSFNAYAYSAGLPIFDWFGRIIGMQTMDVTGGTPYIAVTSVANEIIRPIGDGIVAGPSSFFLVRVIKHLYRALCSKQTDFVTTISDRFGDYLLYTHGYLGVSTTVFTGQNYISSVDANGFTETRYLPDGITYAPGPSKKEVIGLSIRAIAGQVAPLSIVVPGAATVGTVLGTFPDSPLNGLAVYNDVLTHAQCIALGGHGVQIPLSLITWRLKAGDVLNLAIRRSAEDFENVYALKVNLVAFPNYLNFPWYRYHFLASLLGDLTPPLLPVNTFSDPLPLIGGLVLVPAI